MRPSYQQKNYAFPLWVVVSIYASLSVAKGQTIIHVPADRGYQCGREWGYCAGRSGDI